tara:strand:- start:397 stop:636 length:240 start_codon:yes stop_codon:yes gene_type:complete
MSQDLSSCGASDRSDGDKPGGFERTRGARKAARTALHLVGGADYPGKGGEAREQGWFGVLDADAGAMSPKGVFGALEGF